VTDLGQFAGQTFPAGVSADGATIVGNGYDENGFLAAWKWTAGDRFRRLNQTADSSSAAQGISADGTVIVGYAGVGGDPRAVRWQASNGAQQDIPMGSLTYTAAVAANSNASVIIGSCFQSSWIWDAAHGTRVLIDVLKDLGANVTPWTELRVHAISSDGTVIVGGGFNGEVAIQGFIARLGDH
jgi:uncharacterized membrane protein